MIIRAFTAEDVAAMTELWNGVVEAGRAFPQIEPLSVDEAAAFFGAQTRSAVAVEDETIVGLYILHPNNVGRCGHIANASYAVAPAAQHRGVGRALVEDSLASLEPCGFRGLQFNAVVADNAPAIHLYESLGFRRIGVIPEGFRRPDDTYADIIIFHHEAPSERALNTPATLR